MHYYVNILHTLFISLNTKKKSAVIKCTYGPKYFGTHCKKASNKTTSFPNKQPQTFSRNATTSFSGKPFNSFLFLDYTVFL